MNQVFSLGGCFPVPGVSSAWEFLLAFLIPFVTRSRHHLGTVKINNCVARTSERKIRLSARETILIENQSKTK
jgi:hypothetical protein